MRKYKLNNSCTIYVPNSNDEKDYGETFVKKLPALEWKKGTKVCSYFHGRGKITAIDEDSVTVYFYNVNKNSTKKSKKHPIIITYKLDDAKENLRLIRK